MWVDQEYSQVGIVNFFGPHMLSQINVRNNSEPRMQEKKNPYLWADNYL